VSYLILLVHLKKNKTGEVSQNLNLSHVFLFLGFPNLSMMYILSS